MSSAANRLEAIKNQVLYSGPATGKEDIARERANTSFDLEAMKKFWAGGAEAYDTLVSMLYTVICIVIYFWLMIYFSKKLML
jgi:hypothetical protein